MNDILERLHNSVADAPVTDDQDAPNNLPSHLKGLNAPQLEAVEITEGPLLVLSGAGTGKTKVLTSRIANILLTRKAFPGQILAVTFTNKAAREMKERLHSIIGDMAEGLWVGTFHSIAAKILRRHAEIVGLEQNFTILGDDDQSRLIKQILAELGLSDKKWPSRVVISFIQGWKDKAMNPEKARNTKEAAYLEGRAAEIYSIYQSRLRKLNAVDFGDLLLDNITIFGDNPDILSNYGSRFKYILVDEYQDTNVAQYLWLRLLAMSHNNICCVGDDDQSIYSWRGAQIENILRFEKDFENARIIRLEQNYRSTGTILQAASALIANNDGRMGKTLWTDGMDGEPIKLVTCYDDRDEARHVADEVEALQRDKMHLGEMAVLVRAGFQTRVFEERFIAQAIPYRIIGGLRFYERQEIRDVTAYLRLLVQPNDDLAFERIINLPKRGIGDSTVENIRMQAVESGKSMFSIISAMLDNGEIKGRAAEGARKFVGDFMRWGKVLSDLPPHQMANLVIDESGYRDMWAQDKSAEAAGRLENLKELVAALSEFPTMGDFLEHVSLVSDNEGTDDGGKVTLMTLHAAKGLEFRAVFLPGWEEGIFPHQRSMDEKGQEGLEEERRLAYVGITRARERLCILHALNRRVYNQFQSNIPSRFIAELPDECLDRVDNSGYNRGQFFGNSSARNLIDSVTASAADDFEQDWATAPSATSSSSNGIKLGARVFHEKFGQGKVVGISGERVDVLFDSSGLKKLMAEYLRTA
jgi:DNA helicase-2/ATP-dependent DNA helicase PcrA